VRCDECKHWKKDSDNEEWEAKAAGFGECLGVMERWRIMDDSVGPRYLASESDDEDDYIRRRGEALKAARAYVQDGSQYRAELFTAPDFFCALFTART
jgi:hypothetical protein